MSDEIVRCPNCGRRNRVPATASGVPHCGNCHKPLPWIVDAGDDTFAEAAERASVPVVVDPPRLQQRFGVQSIPTLLVMREGKVTSRQVGAAPAAALRSWVERALA